jgi:cation:H+ antiporter
VIVDDGVALGLAALLAPVALAADPKILRSSGIFLVIVYVAAFLMVAWDHQLVAYEGAILLALFAGYLVYSYCQEKRRRAEGAESRASEELEEIESAIKGRSGLGIALLFILGLGGILIGSHMLLEGALAGAKALGLSPLVIGLTVVAIGTSVPEIATAVASALKGHSAVGVGNIIGADILNICWVAGASSLFNPLGASRKEVYLMFPCMFAIVGAMLLMLLLNRYRLGRKSGLVLVLMYVAYGVIVFTMGAPVPPVH